MPRALGSAAASRATNGPQARQSYQSQPSAISAMPATQNEGRCRQVQVSHLPRKSAVASRATAPQARHQSQPSAIISATPATQNEGGCRQVPRLPCKVTVDVPKCHACHAKVARRHGRLTGLKRACEGVPRLPLTPPRHQSQPSPVP